MFTIMNSSSQIQEIITPYSLKLLYVLAYNPTKSFYQRELSRKTNVSLGQTNKILRKLAKHSIVTEEKRGRTYFYKFNMNNALARQIKVMISVSMLNSLIEDLKSLSKKMILFGSGAEGTDTIDSDVDLFVLTTEKEKVRAKISQYAKKMDRKISPIIVDATALSLMKRRDKALYERIMSGMVLWQEE